MNCANCNSTSKLNIAGRDFCADCGTPSTTSSVSVAASTNSTVQNNPAQQSVTSQIITSPSSAATSTTTDSSQSRIDQSTVSSTTPIPNQISTAQNPQIANVSTPHNLDNLGSTNDQNFTAQDNAAQVARQTIESIRNQQPAETANTKEAISKVNQNQSLQTQTNSTAPGVVADTVQTANTSNTQDSHGEELTSLKNKNQDVFSDEQLNQLANQTAQADKSIQNPFSYLQQSDTPTKPVTDIQTLHNTASVQTNNHSINPAAVNDSQVPTQPVQSRTMPMGTIESQNQPQATLQATTSAPANVNVASQHKSKRKVAGGKVASVGLSLAGVILLGVYVWQINYPNLALKVAGSKAGISASLPSNLPNGWRIAGDIQTAPGSVGYKLASADGQKFVAVNQAKTDWDSQAMAENYLNSKTDSYTALQAQGLTIYLYKNNQASWVNHGTWYRIEGSGHGLSQDQIVKMATSL